MAWIKRSLRGTPVYARAKASGALELGPDGRVDVKYNLQEGAKVYRAAGKNLEPPADGDNTVIAVAASAPDPAATADVGAFLAARASTELGSDAPIIIYTDGACAGNPGPMGIGAVILRGKERKEISEFLGTGTNNIAELTAIERALDALEPDDRARSILIHADSAYSIGVLSGAYKAKKNVELIARIRGKAAGFPRLRFVKVAGHAGVSENERCDRLATQAVATRRSSATARPLSGKPESV